MERQVRWLLAWLTQQEAITALLGHAPGPGESTTTQQTMWETARNTLQLQPEFAQPTPTLDPVPVELRDQAEAFKQRADVIATFAGLNWEIGVVDLHTVLSFQKLVVQEQAIERAASVRLDDPETLFSFCLPGQETGINLPGTIDPDQKAITFSSLNPNLRTGGHLILDVDVASAPGQTASKQKFVGFAINFGARFIQIAEYNGRWFVRDGYHRCYGLLRQNVRRIPCVFIRAANFQQLIPEPQGFFSYETLFGARPPMLTNFLDDALSVTSAQLASRKVVRISAEDFVVAIE